MEEPEESLDESESLLSLFEEESEDEEESDEDEEEEEEESDDSTSCFWVMIILGAFFRCSLSSSLRNDSNDGLKRNKKYLISSRLYVYAFWKFTFLLACVVHSTTREAKPKKLTLDLRVQ